MFLLVLQAPLRLPPLLAHRDAPTNQPAAADLRSGAHPALPGHTISASLTSLPRRRISLWEHAYTCG